jgi:Peptidase M16 inactive domain
MRLVVVGAYSCDDLQEMVIRCLSDVPALPRDGSMNGKEYVASWESICESHIAKKGLPFSPSSFKLYRIIPVKDRHNLSITWQLPSQLRRWKSKPCDYIAHLLGHEAQGSLLSALKKKKWVTTCVAGAGGDGMEVRSACCCVPCLCFRSCLTSFAVSECVIAHSIFHDIHLICRGCRPLAKHYFLFVYVYRDATALWHQST